MGSIQGVISNEFVVDPTGTYHRDSDLQIIKDPFNYSLKFYLYEGLMLLYDLKFSIYISAK